MRMLHILSSNSIECAHYLFKIQNVFSCGHNKFIEKLHNPFILMVDYINKIILHTFPKLPFPLRKYEINAHAPRFYVRQIN